jgi:hypothetical protein
MQERRLSIPGGIVKAGARVALGLGLGLLLSRKISRNAHRVAAGGLLAVNIETLNVTNTINVTNTVNVTNTFPILISNGSKPDSRPEDPAA